MRWFDLAPGVSVLEFAPVDGSGLALELRVSIANGHVFAWWFDERGRLLGCAFVGRA